MKTLQIAGISMTFLMLTAAPAGDFLTAEQIVQIADGCRMIAADFDMTIRVETYKDDHLEGTAVIKGTIRDGRNATLVFFEPEDMKGRSVIIKGSDVWLSVPDVKKPIRVSASQRLIGGVSFGDLAGVSFASDYTSTRIGDESVAGMTSDGQKSAPTDCFVLELSGRTARLQYRKIVLWVDKQGICPVKAEFFALSGKKMAVAFYSGVKEWNGKKVITKTYVFDQVNTGRRSVLEYSDLRLPEPVIREN